MNKEDLADRVDAIQKSIEIIVQTLKEMICEAELKPGQQLVQKNIARMFGVSRAPVRDALM